MNRITKLALVAAAALCVAPAGAQAKTVTFSGACTGIKGTASFTDKPGGKADPLPNQSQADRYYSFDSTAASCGGTINGASAPAPSGGATNAVLHVEGWSYVSCSEGTSADSNNKERPGSGTITITGGPAKGTVIPFKMTFTAIGSHVTLTISGTQSGSGGGTADFVNQDDPNGSAAAVTGCLQGTASKLAFEAQSDTKGATLTSDDGTAASSQPSGNSGSTGNSGSSGSSGSGDNSGSNPSGSNPSTSGSSDSQAPASSSKPKPHKKPKKHKKHRGKHKAKGHSKHHGKGKAKGHKKG